MKTTLKFVPGRHAYFLDKRPVPGVTTLLGKGLAKPALPYWAAKTVAEYVVDQPEAVEQLRTMGRGPAVAALKGIPWEARDTAAIRGTAVHDIAERVIHGESVEVPEHLRAHVEGYASWLDEYGVEPVLTERRIASRAYWYAGTFDAIVTIGGERLLIDLKTSRSVYGSTACQCAAYAGAEFYVDDDDEEQPLPEVDGIGVAHVTATGTTFYRFADREAAWKDWRHIQWVANSIPRIDAQLGDPMPVPVKEDA